MHRSIFLNLDGSSRTKEERCPGAAVIMPLFVRPNLRVEDRKWRLIAVGQDAKTGMDWSLYLEEYL